MKHSLFRRRRIRVDTRFQYRFVGLLLAQMAVIVALLVVFTRATMLHIREAVAGLPQLEGTQLRALRGSLDADIRLIYALSLVLIALTVVVLVIVGLRSSHRLAGPVYKLKGYLRGVAEGRATEPIRFRRGDRLDAFAARINEAFGAEASRAEELRAALDGLLAGCHELEAEPDAARTSAIAQAMEEYVHRLRRQSVGEGQP